MNRDGALDYLYRLGNEVVAMKLGLEAMRALLDRVGRPHESFPCAHVAGTNGKGSVSAMLDAIARQAGIRTGLYTSPHLVDIEERIRVDGHPIAGERFAAHATRVRDAAERLVDDGVLPALPTFFEQVTAIAFLEFAARRVALAVVEVGLGGRLDATNVLDPLVTVITPVSFDHEQYLGSTLTAIAGEKAGILKPGAPAVIGRQEPEALETILQRCRELNVASTVIGQPEIHHNELGRFTFSYSSAEDRYEHLRPSLRGRHQVDNAITALHAAEALRKRGLPITKGAIARGVASVDWPARLEVVSGAPPVLLDGAHNAAGAAALRRYLDEIVPGPITLVFGVLDDKDANALAAELFPAASRIALTRPSTPRASDPADLSRRLPVAIGTQVAVAHSTAEALEWALDVTPPNGLVCVAGSLYLVGEARAWLAARVPAGGVR